MELIEDELEDTFEQKQIESEQASQTRLAPIWETAGIRPRYPISSANVVRLLFRNGYAIDDAFLAKAIDGRMFQAPVPHGGIRRWRAEHICRLIDQLEFLRRWQPGSPQHAAKMTPYELADTGFEDLGDWSFSDIVAMLHQPGCDLPARQALAHALKLKLAAAGIEAV